MLLPSTLVAASATGAGTGGTEGGGAGIGGAEGGGGTEGTEGGAATVEVCCGIKEDDSPSNL